jgi:GT2 family glycosyltransferase
VTIDTCRVTVIVVNWNRRDLLRACLESVAPQRGASFEVVLVDNGSADGSVEMAESEFAEKLALRVIRNADNRGFCAANNQGIAAARGEFIALLNNDAEADPGWLAALLRVFVQNEVGMAASKILVWENPERIDKAGHLIYPDGQNRGRGSGELDRGQYDRLEEALWPDGCAAMYRRAMLEEIGGFDEDFFAYADDAELGLRARIAGWNCLYVPDAVVRHHRGATLGVFSLRRVELIERNRILLAAKLFPWSLLCLNPFYYAARLLAGVWAALHGKGEIGRFPAGGSRVQVGLALLRADCEAITMLPRILAKRKSIKRRLSARQLRRLLARFRIPLRTLTQEAIG